MEDKSPLQDLYAQYLIGLRPTPDGSGLFELCPSFPCGLEHFYACYCSFTVEWRRLADEVEYQVNVPTGAVVLMAPPVGWKLKGERKPKLFSGNYSFLLERQSLLREQNCALG